MVITEKAVIEALGNVDDPDLNQDLVTLNMIKDIRIDGLKVSFSVVLTTPACPMKDMIQKACENAIIHYVDQNAEVAVNMTANVSSNNSEGPVLPNVKNIIAVASGKGGVGKSTIAANLAVSLAQDGASVGVVDADIYGPSMPLMFDVVDGKPGMSKQGDKSLIVPVENYGVKILSIGFFANSGQAVPWRGPMASKALRQLMVDADWGDLDYLIVDLPPGTGDIHLTFVQAVPVTAAVIVTTPQAVALADAEKGINMFTLPAINVPVLGLIENMAYFTPAELPDNKYYIFGKDGGKNLAEKAGVPLLGQVPIVQSIREAGDVGRPAALQTDSPVSETLKDVARAVAQQVSIINSQPRREKQTV